MQYDITSKIIVENGKEAILRVFQNRCPLSSELIETLPQEQPTLKKGDYIIKITEPDGREEIQVWEFKTIWKKEDIKNLMQYTLRLEQQYKIPVTPYLFLFLPSSSATDVYEDNRFRFQFVLIKLWELDSNKILESEDYVLYPFIPIMANGETVTLEAEKKLYNSTLKKEDKSDLLTAMTIFAGLKDKSLCATLIKRRRDIMIESYGYRLIKDEGFAEGKIEGKIEGKNEGKIEGEIKGLRDGILLALDFRYGQEAQNLAHSIKKIDSLEILTNIYNALRQKNGLECIERMLK
ncbi:MAG: hypothetical protein C4527_17920 [Candidatus Omnitrophota bacterium]|jgi:predicted transposase YdaD|nr:MAG: hypothetical protein C4527_17920 [Candidatus Omnitrophota bacterium]